MGQFRVTPGRHCASSDRRAKSWGSPCPRTIQGFSPPWHERRPPSPRLGSIALQKWSVSGKHSGQMQWEIASRAISCIDSSLPNFQLAAVICFIIPIRTFGRSSYMCSLLSPNSPLSPEVPVPRASTSCPSLGKAPSSAGTCRAPD